MTSDDNACPACGLPIEPPVHRHSVEYQAAKVARDAYGRIEERHRKQLIRFFNLIVPVLRAIERGEYQMTADDRRQLDEALELLREAERRLR